MNKHTVIFLLLINIIIPVSAQKKVVDFTAIDSWPTVDAGTISANGKWFSWRGYNGFPPKNQNLSIISLDKKVNYFFDNASGAQFSPNSEFMCFKIGNNLNILKLGNKEPGVLKEVGSYRVFEYKNTTYIQYVELKEPGKFFLKNLSTGKLLGFENSTVLLISKNKVFYSKSLSSETKQFLLFDLNSSTTNIIWKGASDPSGLIISEGGNQICFVADNRQWYATLGRTIITEEMKFPKDGEFSHLEFHEFISFEAKEKLIKIWLKHQQNYKAFDWNEELSIYSFQDTEFELGRDFLKERTTVLYNIETKSFISLEKHNEELKLVSEDGKYAVIVNRWTSEYYWNRKAQGSFYIKNIDNEKSSNPISSIYTNSIILSKDNKHCFFTSLAFDIFSMDMETGSVVNLTKNISLVPNKELEETPARLNFRFQIVSENFESRYLLVTDNRDIYMVDKWGKSEAICITGEFGQKNNISFKLLDKSVMVSKNNTQIYLSAYNRVNKDAGFFKVNWADLSNPVQLSMGPNHYSDRGVKKARKSNIWMVQREGDDESPNYYWTTDFKSFNAISNNHPENKYLWHSSELMVYTTKNGVKNQMILYKPENFDPAKKYPVLFTFYEQETFKLNIFRQPKYTDFGYTFNLPLMLAKGYLICIPDIHFKIGEPAKSTLDCIEAAVDVIVKKSYVDKDRLGAAGGSFGGYEINCLAAFSHSFKALYSGSGISNLFSKYGNFPGLRDEDIENRQGRMGTTPSRNPKAFADNSPFAFAKDVTTPILIAHGGNDKNVNPQQGFEWFNSLRREGKQSWLLWYPTEDHGLGTGNEKIDKDLSIRMSQFFDHYLKGAPVPNWMLESNSVIERSGHKGLLLNPSVKEIGPGLNTPEDLKKLSQPH